MLHAGDIDMIDPRKGTRLSGRFRDFGRSSRPAEMAQPAAASRPVIRMPGGSRPAS